MIFKYFTRFYPIPLKKNPKTLQKFTSLSGRLSYQGIVIPSITQTRLFAGEKDPVKSGKEEQMTIKMPGFISPETMKEEGYFTQKARQQLEELKRKRDDVTPGMHSPDKK